MVRRQAPALIETNLGSSGITYKRLPDGRGPDALSERDREGSGRRHEMLFQRRPSLGSV